MSVEVNNLTKIYGTQKALDNVSFSVSEGDILGFLGPNGAGKSTTMKILSCFIPQTSGEATIGGKNVKSESLEVRRLVGYLLSITPYIRICISRSTYCILPNCMELPGLSTGLKI